jgi:hypothetical protein
MIINQLHIVSNGNPPNGGPKIIGVYIFQYEVRSPVEKKPDVNGVVTLILKSHV